MTDISSEKIKTPNMILRILSILLVLAASILVYFYFIETSPRAERRTPVAYVPTLEAIPIVASSHTIFIKGMGTVVPAQIVTLKSRVAGEIAKISSNFVEGGLLKAGEVALNIDKTDYELALAIKKDVVTNANYLLKLEMGHQEVAKREWELLKHSSSVTQGEQELALRQPHLEKAKAALESAKAEEQKALLDLERTSVIAPFNSIIKTKFVELGSQVSQQESLAQLIGTDTYHIRMSVQIERLPWFDIPVNESQTAGAHAYIKTADGRTFEGVVLRLLGDLSPAGRMATVIISVEDPLGLKSGSSLFKLLIDEYVEVTVEGKTVENTIIVPRNAFRENNIIWTADEGNKLHIRETKVIWKDSDVVIIENTIPYGEKLIISDISGPIEGMSVKISS